MITTREVNVRGFSFRSLEAGSGGEPGLLLHGFPETSLMWTDVMTALAEAGKAHARMESSEHKGKIILAVR